MFLIGLLLINLIESRLPLSDTNVVSVSSASSINILSGTKAGWHPGSVKYDGLILTFRLGVYLVHNTIVIV
jgi:hypothetical protein